MRLRGLLLSLVFFLAAVPFARTEEKTAVADGNYVFSIVTPTGDSAICLLKIETKDGKPSLTVLSSPPNNDNTVTTATTDKGLSFTMRSVQTFKDAKGKERKGMSLRTFVAAPGKDGKVIFGSFGVDPAPQRAKLTATDSEKLTTMFVRSDGAEQMTKGNGLNFKTFQLKNQIRQSKDADKKKELREQLETAQKEADEKMPVLCREVVEKYPGSPSAADAATILIGMSEKAKLKPAEAASLTKLVLKQADAYGPRYSKLIAIRLADSLVHQTGLEGVALIPIEPIVKALTDKDPLNTQFDLLTTYKAALDGAKKATEAKVVEGRLAKLDVALDKEWEETVPPFKASPFAGRKDKDATRVTVLELFTGAQCPPCVAADVAFDALNKAYQPKDLILLQYHMHIPGPDPLTNADTVGRWDYYVEQYPYDPETGEGIGGTPTTIFNGKPLSGGGGGMANSQAKFNDYKRIIDPLLEKTTELKMKGRAARSGDKLSIGVEVAGAESADHLKLRLVLVEDTIKYVGSNKVRFHHHVVRAMPGGVDGVAVKEGSMKHTVTTDIGALRKDLEKYLDEYAAKERPFPYPTIRPLDMKSLKVVALVQNDKTREVLQAVQIDVESKSAGE